MREDIDADAGTILDGLETVAQAGRRLYREIVRVASGSPVGAGRWGHHEFQIWIEEALAIQTFTRSTTDRPQMSHTGRTLRRSRAPDGGAGGIGPLGRSCRAVHAAPRV